MPRMLAEPLEHMRMGEQLRTMGDPTTIEPAGEFLWEDIVVGEKLRSNGYRVSEAEIVEFAGKYDPMPPHLGAEELFGTVIAAGTHVLAIRQKLVHDFAFVRGVVASLGHDEVRFLAPLRPDQLCMVEIVFISKRPSRSRQDRGIIVTGMTLLADEQPVMTLRDTAIMRRRQSPDEA